MSNNDKDVKAKIEFHEVDSAFELLEAKYREEKYALEKQSQQRAEQLFQEEESRKGIAIQKMEDNQLLTNLDRIKREYGIYDLDKYSMVDFMAGIVMLFERNKTDTRLLRDWVMNLNRINSNKAVK